MIERNLIIVGALLLWAFGPAAGCGYKLSGTGTTLPSHIGTIAIPILTNSSPEPEIHRDLTNAIREAFINDGRLKVVDESRADMLVQGDLHHYNLRAVSFTTRDVVAEYWVELGVNVNVKDRVKNRTYLKQDLRTKWDFQTDPDVASTESARLQALDEAYRELSHRLVSLVIEQF